MKTYLCARCHGVFETDWTDEEAQAEYAIEFPDVPIDTPTVVVCDDCYRGVGEWAKI